MPRIFLSACRTNTQGSFLIANCERFSVEFICGARKKSVDYCLAGRIPQIRTMISRPLSGNIRWSGNAGCL